MTSYEFRLPAAGAVGSKRVRVTAAHSLAGTEGSLLDEVPELPGVYLVACTKPAPGLLFPAVGERFRIALADLEAVL